MEKYNEHDNFSELFHRAGITETTIYKTENKKFKNFFDKKIIKMNSISKTKRGCYCFIQAPQKSGSSDILYFYFVYFLIQF